MKRLFFVVIAALMSFILSAQNQLSFGSVFQREIIFSANNTENIITDSIQVPQGFVLKIESSSLSMKTSNVNGIPFYTSYTNAWSQPAFIFIDSQQISRISDEISNYSPVWLNEGKHYINIYFRSGIGTVVNGLASINGILFKIDP